MTCNHHWHISPEQKGCGPELQTCCRCDARRDVMNRNTGLVMATNCHTMEGKKKFGRMVSDYDWASVREMEVTS